MINVFKNTNYNDKNFDKNLLIDTNELFLVQIFLKAGQSVPKHNANSNVHILVIEGTINIKLENIDNITQAGIILPVKHLTNMEIFNNFSENASFLVIKTPNPKKMGI